MYIGYPDKIPPGKNTTEKIPLNAVEREPVPTRVLNPNASEASQKPKQCSYRKTKLKKISGGFYIDVNTRSDTRTQQGNTVAAASASIESTERYRMTHKKFKEIQHKIAIQKFLSKTKILLDSLNSQWNSSENLKNTQHRFQNIQTKNLGLVLLMTCRQKVSPLKNFFFVINFQNDFSHNFNNILDRKLKTGTHNAIWGVNVLPPS